MPNEKHLVKKKTKPAHCKVSFQCSILQSLPAAPHLVAKRHVSYNITRTTYGHQGKLITVSLQAEKEGSVTFTVTLYFSLLL